MKVNLMVLIIINILILQVMSSSLRHLRRSSSSSEYNQHDDKKLRKPFSSTEINNNNDNTKENNIIDLNDYNNDNYDYENYEDDESFNYNNDNNDYDYNSINDDHDQELSGCFEPIQVMCELNGFVIPAMIDTGAQISVISSSCAQRCRIAQQMDTRYAGKAVGVGSTDILGRINEVATRLGPVTFNTKLSVLRKSGAEFILGLDFLRRFRCQINMNEEILTMQVRDKVLRIPMLRRGRETDSHIAYENFEGLSNFLDESDENEEHYSSNNNRNTFDYDNDFDVESNGEGEERVSMEGV